MELMQASHQWATRPDDERFTSLTELLAHTKRQREQSIGRVMPNRAIAAAPIEGDLKGLAIIDRKSEVPAMPSNWAFTQLCGSVGAPAKYLRSLPAPMAADCINHGLEMKDVEELGVLLRQNGGPAELAAVTGPNYGRVWNAEIAQALVRRFGDGVTGDFRIPGEFGQAVEITKANTTLYAGDRDMFVFLADEQHRIEVPNRRNGQSGSLARGLFVYNSEVGAQTLGVAAFLFDYACSNRIVWGAQDFREIKIRHTSGAPHRWIEQVQPAIQRYANGAASIVQDKIAEAMAKKLGDKEKVDEFLLKRFTRPQVKAIKLSHEVEEGRPIETLWDVATGATAYAKSIPWQDERVDIERKAGAVLSMAS
jgi:hypothetical protein